MSQIDVMVYDDCECVRAWHLKEVSFLKHAESDVLLHLLLLGGPSSGVLIIDFLIWEFDFKQGITL